MLAFTTRIPLAVMIAMGIKQWENRSAMPSPACGQCGMTCSKSSDAREEFIDIQGEILEEKTGRRQPELPVEQKKRYFLPI